MLDGWAPVEPKNLKCRIEEKIADGLFVAALGIRLVLDENRTNSVEQYFDFGGAGVLFRSRPVFPLGKLGPQVMR